MVHMNRIIVRGLIILSALVLFVLPGQARAQYLVWPNSGVVGDTVTITVPENKVPAFTSVSVYFFNNLIGKYYSAKRTPDELNRTITFRVPDEFKLEISCDDVNGIYSCHQSSSIRPIEPREYKIRIQPHGGNRFEVGTFTLAETPAEVEYSRAKAAHDLVRSAHLPFDTSDGPHFNDVPNTHPNYAAIETLFNHKVTNGCASSPRRYCPGQAITRGQLAVFIAKALDLPLFNGPPRFSDVPGSHPFYLYIDAVARAGIVTGFSNNTFKPNAVPTKDAAANIHDRVEDYWEVQNPQEMVSTSETIDFLTGWAGLLQGQISFMSGEPLLGLDPEVLTVEGEESADDIRGE